MKKIFAILIATVLLAACNNAVEKKEDVKSDSINAESPLMDAVNTADSVGKALQDSSKKMKDSPKEQMNP